MFIFLFGLINIRILFKILYYITNPQYQTQPIKPRPQNPPDKKCSRGYGVK